MGPTQFVLWSTSRGGWLTAGAFTTTELDKADKVEEAEALKLCKVHAGGNTMNLIPVDYLMIKEIRG